MVAGLPTSKITNENPVFKWKRGFLILEERQVKKMKKTLKVILTGLLVATILLIATDCFAENALDKLNRGLANGILGWVEVPREIVNISQDYTPFGGISYGTVKGTAKGTGRTIVGVYDTATFLVPPYDYIIIEPEFPF